MYVITNGLIITENEMLEGYDLIISNGRIENIIKKGTFEKAKNYQVIDACGGYVTPGFIDIHSDYIEQMAAPRPMSLMDFNLSIREVEKQLMNHGITTIFHSLSLYKTKEFTHKPIRDPKNVRKFINLIDKAHTSSHLIRHRFHARYEIDNLEEVNNLNRYIEEKKVHLISFMDHTPGQGQYRDLEIFRDTIKGYNNLSDDEIDKIIAHHQTKEKITMEVMENLANNALDQGIAIASHDDDSKEKIELVKSLGATISEFPITLDVAMEARKQGLHTIAGAPNILLGGSHSGNLSAEKAIQAGCINILCSDYYPPALLHALFVMESRCDLGLVELVKFLTINPAKAVNMDQEIGSIKQGKKADLIIIEKIEDEFPVISNVFVNGSLVSQTHYRK